jgi:hypothetical protein
MNPLNTNIDWNSQEVRRRGRVKEFSKITVLEKDEKFDKT